LERRIAAHHSSEKLRQLSAQIGYHSLIESVKMFGNDHEYTKLIPSLKDVDPDDAFSAVPYEKGFLFLYKLENIVGGASVMEEYLKAHCNKFKYSSITSQEFKAFFMDYFSSKISAESLNSIDWEKEFYTAGLPESPQFDDTLTTDCMRCIDLLIAGKSLDDNKDDKNSNWKTIQKIRLLDMVLERVEGSNSNKDKEMKSWIKPLNDCFGFGKSTNSEIRLRWYTILLKLGDRDCMDKVISFITSQGRMKYVRPLYRALYKSKKGKELAMKTFTTHRGMYHNICAKMVAKDLELQ